jgi:hypothetical protein
VRIIIIHWSSISYKQKLTNENIADEPGLLRGLFQTTKTSQLPGMIQRNTKIF